MYKGAATENGKTIIACKGAATENKQTIEYKK